MTRVVAAKPLLCFERKVDSGVLGADQWWDLAWALAWSLSCVGQGSGVSKLQPAHHQLILKIVQLECSHVRSFTYCLWVLFRLQCWVAEYRKQSWKYLHSAPERTSVQTPGIYDGDECGSEDNSVPQAEFSKLRVISARWQGRKPQILLSREQSCSNNT